jgi:hypothetical protein
VPKAGPDEPDEGEAILVPVFTRLFKQWTTGAKPGPSSGSRSPTDRPRSPELSKARPASFNASLYSVSSRRLC